MQRVALITLFVLTLGFNGLLAAEPAVAADAKAEAKADAKVDVKVEAKAGVTKVARPKGPTPGGPKDKNAIWWEDDGIVKALSLTDAQRKKMAEYLKAYRKKVPKPGKPEDFQEALVQGDWKKAGVESEKVAKRAELSVQMRGKLKIDVLSLLSKQQHETLVDRYPRLIYKPWRRAMRDASSR